MMDGPEIVQPEGWLPPSGYANAVSARGRILSVAGQTGWNPRTQAFEAHDMVGQVRQALENVVAVLRAAGAEPRHLVRLTWYVVERKEYEGRRREIGEAYRAVIGRHFPAMTLVIVAGLLEPLALVEIEATAVVPDV
ncbi:MAG TPA: RidA family protein [Gemmatimonadales bacterium]|nr:RidA family protein [Gemmatimonadales bacterium]